MKRVLIAIALICAVFCVHIFHIGARGGLYNVDPTKTDSVITMKNDGVAVTAINQQNLNSLYENLDTKNMSEYEKNVTVLKDLGISDEIIQSMGQDEVNDFLKDAASIQVEVKYLLTDSEGETTVIGEEECMDLLDQCNENSARSASDNGGFAADEFEGCMRITVSSVYIDPSSNNDVEGWFHIHAWYEWLILDNHRHTDVISISDGGNFVWDDQRASYTSSCYYTVKDLNGNTSSYKETAAYNSGSFYSRGYGYTWPLPKNSGNSLEVTYLQYYLHGKGCVSFPSQPLNFNINAGYEHIVQTLSANVQVTYEWVSSENDGTFTYTITPTLNIDTVPWLLKNTTKYVP